MDQCNVPFDFGDQIPVWFLVQAQWILFFCSGSLDGHRAIGWDTPAGIAGVTPTPLCRSPAHTIPGGTGVTILSDAFLNRKPNSVRAVLKAMTQNFLPYLSGTSEFCCAARNHTWYFCKTISSPQGWAWTQTLKKLCHSHGLSPDSFKCKFWSLPLSLQKQTEGFPSP